MPKWCSKIVCQRKICVRISFGVSNNRWKRLSPQSNIVLRLADTSPKKDDGSWDSEQNDLAWYLKWDLTSEMCYWIKEVIAILSCSQKNYNWIKQRKMNTEKHISELKRLFPITKHWIYLYNGSVHPCPTPVADAMQKHLEQWQNGGEAVFFSAWGICKAPKRSSLS